MKLYKLIPKYRKDVEEFILNSEKNECRYCGMDCNGQHAQVDEENFIDICDDCLCDKLSEEEVLQE